ncbi:MAG: fumarate hydratase [Promethearchaeota archaeon]
MSSIIEETVFDLLRFAATELPKDVEDTIKQAYEEETNPTAKTQLKAIIDNFTLATKTRKPMCQDSGILLFYVKAGLESPYLHNLEEKIKKGSIQATKEVPLRPNAVDIWGAGNSGNNIGHNIPFINYELVPGSDLTITALPKGGGSENMCALGMLKPGEGIKGIKKFVVDTVFNASGRPCPPIVVAVGIGGGSDVAFKIAKKKLLEPLGERNKNPEVAKMELELLNALNKLGIGPMGLGGDISVLDVKIDYAHRHPASLPVAVVVQCWAARRASATISKDGKVTFHTHSK